MFESITMQLDFKDITNMKNSLENKIEYLKMNSFADEEIETIQEHEDLLQRITKIFQQLMLVENDD